MPGDGIDSELAALRAEVIATREQIASLEAEIRPLLDQTAAVLREVAAKGPMALLSGLMTGGRG